METRSSPGGQSRVHVPSRRQPEPEKIVRQACYAIVFALVAVLPCSAHAQSITAFKASESTTGLTKQCVYKFGTTAYTKTIGAVEFCPLSLEVALTPPAPGIAPGRSVIVPPVAPAAINTQQPYLLVFKKGERTTGLTKQCTYSFGETEYSRTIGAVELCPLSIKVAP